MARPYCTLWCVQRQCACGEDGARGMEGARPISPQSEQPQMTPGLHARTVLLRRGVPCHQRCCKRAIGLQFLPPLSLSIVCLGGSISGVSSSPLSAGSLCAGHRAIDAMEAKRNVRRSVEPVLAAYAGAYLIEKAERGLFKVYSQLQAEHTVLEAYVQIVGARCIFFPVRTANVCCSTRNSISPSRM